MYDCWRRYSKHAWAAWLPLLFVGAMLFWTVALGLGGLSLMAVSAFSPDCSGPDLIGPAPTATEPMPGSSASGEGIVVRLQESTYPQDLDRLRAGSVEDPAEEFAEESAEIGREDIVEVVLEDAVEDVGDSAGAAPPSFDQR